MTNLQIAPLFFIWIPLFWYFTKKDPLKGKIAAVELAGLLHLPYVVAAMIITVVPVVIAQLILQLSNEWFFVMMGLWCFYLFLSRERIFIMTKLVFDKIP